MQYCECGFTDASIAFGDVGSRSQAATSGIADLLRAHEQRAGERPSPQRWSALEYGAHVRDVLVTIRDRMVVGLVEDDPSFTPMYRDERISLGLYADDAAGAIADEVETVQAMFARVFGRLDADALARPVRYGSPDPIETTVGWMGKQAVHECEHHLDDIRENLRLPDG